MYTKLLTVAGIAASNPTTTNAITTGLSDEAATTNPQLERIAAEDSPLVGPTWTAIKYYNETTGALVDVLQSTSITLEFEDDDTLDGHSGCNNYFTGYSDLANSSFAVAGPMGSTMMMCEEDILRNDLVCIGICQLKRSSIWGHLPVDGTIEHLEVSHLLGHDILFAQHHGRSWCCPWVQQL